MLSRRSLLAAVVASGISALLGDSQSATAGGGRGMRVNKPSRKTYRPSSRFLYYREPRLLFVTSQEERSQTHLARLQKTNGDFELLKERGWEIGPQANDHLQLISVEDRPDIVERYDASEFPWVGCLENGQIERLYTGDSNTMLDAWTLVWLLTGEDRRPRPDVEIEPRDTQYPTHGGHWIVSGDHAPVQEKVLAHLRSSIHVRQIPDDWKIDQWSYAELRSLHDDLHRNGRPQELVKTA